MRIAPKLAICTAGIILLLGVVGTLGLIAGNRIISHFEGNQEHLKTIVLEASEVDSHAKRTEIHLMLFLTLHDQEDKKELLAHHASLRLHLSRLKKTINTRNAAAAFKRMRAAVDSILPLCNALITAHDLDLEASGFFSAKNHEEQILELYRLTSEIRRTNLEITEFATESLNRQVAITAASEISSTAKNLHSHLILFLALQNPEDKVHFFESYSQIQDHIALLDRRLQNPEAREILARLRNQASAILPSGIELFEAMESDLATRGHFLAEEHRNSIMQFFQLTSDMRATGSELTLFNANQEIQDKGNATREARKLQRQILITWSIAIIVALIIGHLLKNSIVGPIMKLKRATVEIAQGKLTTDIGISSHDEFGNLAENFREMAMTLFLRTTALKSSNERLQHEINERQAAEEALRNSEAFYRAIVEDQTELVCRFRPDNTLTFVNEAYCIYFGKQREELLGSTFMPMILAEDRPRVDSGLASLSPKNRVFTHEHRVIAPNGSIRWQQWTNRMIVNDANELIEYQAVGRDITDQKNMEQAIRHGAEKIKLFAYSVSHDLKNPAIAIYGLSKILQEKYRDSLDEKGQAYCRQIFHSSEQVASLVDKINQYISTTESPLRIESVNLDQVLKMIADEFSLPIQLRRIKWRVPERLPEFKADRLSILRVLRNFVDNALKYGGDSLSEIRFGYEEGEHHHILSVSNDGISIPEKSYDKIFRLFQRDETSSGITGTGLGLAIVKEIIEQHGGTAWLGPKKGGGVTFYVSIAKDLAAAAVPSDLATIQSPSAT